MPTRSLHHSSDVDRSSTKDGVVDSQRCCKKSSPAAARTHRRLRGIAGARKDFDEFCRTLPRSGTEWERLRERWKAAEPLLLRHPAGFPKSFFQLLLPSSKSVSLCIPSGLWDDFRLLCGNLFGQAELHYDLDSCVVAMSAFLYRFLLKDDSRDLFVVIKIIRHLETSETRVRELLPSGALFDAVSGDLLVPAAVYINSQRNGEDHEALRFALTKLMVFALFSDELLTEEGAIENPLASALRTGDTSALSEHFFATCKEAFTARSTEEAEAVACCLLRIASQQPVPPKGNRCPLEAFFIRLAGLADIGCSADQDFELSDRKVTLLGSMLHALTDSNFLLNSIVDKVYTLQDWIARLLTALIRDRQREIPSLNLVTTLLEVFPSVAFDSTREIIIFALTSAGGATASEAADVLTRLLETYAQARLVPKFLGKFLAVVREGNFWSPTESLSEFKRKLGLTFESLVQSQVLSIVKTLQYHLTDAITDAFGLLSAVLQLVLKNAQLPTVGVAPWLDSISSDLSVCIRSVDNFENSAPLEHLKFLLACGEWIAFVAHYKDALAGDLDVRAPSFVALLRELREKLGKINESELENVSSFVLMNVADVRCRLEVKKPDVSSRVLLTVRNLEEDLENETTQESEALCQLGSRIDSWDWISAVCSMGLKYAANIANRRGVLKGRKEILNLCELIRQCPSENDVEKILVEWTSVVRGLISLDPESAPKSNVTDFVELISCIVVEHLSTPKKLCIFVTLTTLAALDSDQTARILDVISRLLDSENQGNMLVRTVASHDNLEHLMKLISSSSTERHRVLLEQLVTTSWLADDTDGKKSFLQFVSSSRSVEIHIAVLKRKAGEWKNVARKLLSAELEKHDGIQNILKNDLLLQVLHALITDGKMIEQRLVDDFVETLLKHPTLLDSLPRSSAENCLKILAKAREANGEIIWEILSGVQDWRRLLLPVQEVNESRLWMQILAESVKKTCKSTETPAVETCLNLCFKKYSKEDRCVSVSEAIVKRFSSEVKDNRESAVGTLWMASLAFAKMTDSEIYAERDSMTMKLSHEVKILALTAGSSLHQEWTRELFASYMHLHSLFLDDAWLKWIFVFGGYQLVLCRLLDENCVFDDVGVFGFTSSCEVMYQALRKPGLVVTGWEHVFCRHLFWAWRLLCRWVSDCNEDFDAVGVADARARRQVSFTTLAEARLNLVTCANALVRVVDLIKQKHSSEFARLAPYVIVDAVTALSSKPVLPELKKYLNAFVFKLLDLCDESSVAYLKLAFDDVVCEVYDKLYDEYRRHGKFVGRV